jgi:2-iminoacetate synthase
MVELKFTAKDIIQHEVIEASLQYGKQHADDHQLIHELLEKASLGKGLNPKEAAVLLHTQDPELVQLIFKTAKNVKERIYGRRIVLFAPLYVSNDSKCISMENLANEVKVLESLGYKRLVLEAGEDPNQCSIDYILDCIQEIYAIRNGQGNIRRINVNMPATTRENYTKLHAAGIGTYILSQETYHKPTFMQVYASGAQRDYDWHMTAMHRAMQSGIDDVGLGVIYGLYDFKYDTLGMLMHAEHLERIFGIGPHTISVPRLREVEGEDLSMYPLVSNEQFKHIIAILRLSLPYAGIILSNREEPAFRENLISLGVTQISTGSCIGLGGSMEDGHCSPLETIKSLCTAGYLPSHCTACYREGRSSDRFKEYMMDYGDLELRELHI